MSRTQNSSAAPERMPLLQDTIAALAASQGQTAPAAVAAGAGCTSAPGTAVSGMASAKSAPATPVRKPSDGGRRWLVDDRPFSARDWAIVGIAIAQAVIWSLAFWVPDIADSWWAPGLDSLWIVLPGVGFTLMSLVGFASLLAVLGRRARLDRTTIPLLAACVLMCLLPSIYGNGILRLLNLLVLLPVGTFTCFLVANIWPRCELAIGSFLESAGCWLLSMFRLPFKAFREAFRSLRRSPHKARYAGMRKEVLVGAAVAIALLAVALPLLISADSVFESIFARGYDALAELLVPGEGTLRVLYALVALPPLLGLLWGFSRLQRRPDARETGIAEAFGNAFRPLTMAIALGALDALYLLFCAVQFVYLFGGAESAAMAGGFAEYARSGFFQLVAVVAVNVVVGLVAVRFALSHAASAGDPASGSTDVDTRSRREALAVRMLVMMLIALSLVIVVSAWWRMSLYVGAYGLTILRCLTYLGMVLAVILLATLALKAFRPQTAFFRTLLLAGVALWLAFNIANVDARIADYNVDNYIAGNLEQIDAVYLNTLSPDADDALARLADYLDEHPDKHIELGSWGDLRERSLENGRPCDLLPWQMQCLAYWR